MCVGETGLRRDDWSPPMVASLLSTILNFVDTLVDLERLDVYERRCIDKARLMVATWGQTSH